MNEIKERLALRLSRLLSPGEWTARLLGLSRSQGSSSKPGLVLIQIDGFSKSTLETALNRNEMPFLKHLIENEKYRLHSYYSGLPSTTPSIQGELFYGVKQCVPSFFFYDKETKKVFRMFDGEAAREIEKRLEKMGPGLLAGGGSYSNVFTGGAQEAHFCAGSLGWHHIWKDVNFINFFLLLLTHFLAVIRMALLTFLETVLAVIDFIYGVFKKEDLIVEFKFIPLRVLICILLRELITLGATIDVARGLPVIHLNFLGYDEQAHRRGPGSRTAHWALRGIDAAISRICFAANNSSRRHYDVWIYSDHGQEPTIPYIGYHGKSVEEAVEEAFHRLFGSKELSKKEKALKLKKERERGVQLQRIRYLGKWLNIWDFGSETRAVEKEDIVVAAMGPLGGIYIFKDLSREEKVLFAQELVSSVKVPLVLMPEENGKVRAWNERGAFVLPDQAAEVLEAGHPFFEEITQDLVTLCHHPNAGTFTISGWRLEGRPFSFPFENGAHAGPGKEETNAFALLPSDAVAIPLGRSYLKTMDLREGALKLIKGGPGSRYFNIVRKDLNKASASIRLMTYNVHSCVGMDGKVSAERIARVIGRYQPDIVALQEVDMGRRRTGGVDQPHLIAKELEMLYHFHPSIQVEEEMYGNAILSRFPVDLIQAAPLPRFKAKFNLEPRGAIWVAIQIGNIRVQLINAHLGFYAPECHYQANALMGSEWVAHPNCCAPLVLCGDFNCLPKSPAWRTINQKLHDVQHALEEHRPLATWSGRYPIGRIDHIFISSGIKVSAIEVPRTRLDKVASDHLPLIVDLQIPLS